MRERPIRLKAHEVRAILSGAKSQTRRAVEPPPDHRADWIRSDMNNVWHAGIKAGQVPEFGSWKCPFGQPGDRLWVRETWRPSVIHSCAMDACDCDSVGVTYAADGEWIAHTWHNPPAEDWCMPDAAARGNVPSIHMPRWACRLMLEITDVRVERLQAISEADALAEGITRHADGHGFHVEDGRFYAANPVTSFADLWGGTGGDWDADPWMWVISFQRLP